MSTQTNNNGEKTSIPLLSVPILMFSLLHFCSLSSRSRRLGLLVGVGHACPADLHPSKQHHKSWGLLGLRRRWSSRTRGRDSYGVRISTTVCLHGVLAHHRPCRWPHLGCHSTSYLTARYEKRRGGCRWRRRRKVVAMNLIGGPLCFCLDASGGRMRRGGDGGWVWIWWRRMREGASGGEVGERRKVVGLVPWSSLM